MSSKSKDATILVSESQIRKRKRFEASIEKNKKITIKKIIIEKSNIKKKNANKKKVRDKEKRKKRINKKSLSIYVY